MTLITDDLRQELTKFYTHPSRHYHSLRHVEALLALLSAHRDKFYDPEAVEAAIWFHDAIYDPRAKGNVNEVRSAELAMRHLSGQVDAVRLEGIRVMIEATATHTVPDLPSAEGVTDAMMFLDMDLSILGADEAEFDEYEVAVRKEYAHVNDAEWKEGRAAVLKRFLEREWIYHSELFRELLEEKARANLRRSLERLGKSGP
ncbi:hypothetical protein QBC40DRAFT_325736 [Triangularia verruculosa]|uniref:Metal-dependent HD superfamily phosphohydrolase n=1 Tax=Triangularia verruculosa TaxID=2587418 RepID=A0AAN7AZV4_9PEZI|nr:hypothetical protein QBC40DRAFT_325736 [Triangularia verruculosa]